MARELDGEMSCPRCARKNRAVAMYSTALALSPNRRPAQFADDPARPAQVHSPRTA
jgi:hypothetical protein